MDWLSEFERGPVREWLFECLKCGHEWMVEGHEEYGTWFPEHDDDLFCPECGSDGGEG